MYVFLQEGRIIIFNEWLCICFVGKHDSLGQMSSSFLGLLGANGSRFSRAIRFSHGKWVQNMVLQDNPNSLGKHGSLEQIGPTSFEQSWFPHRKLPGETLVSAFFPLEVRETW